MAWWSTSHTAVWSHAVGMRQRRKEALPLRRRHCILSRVIHARKGAGEPSPEEQRVVRANHGL